MFFIYLFIKSFCEQPLQLDDSMRLPKETIDILKDQVFGFDTFFVTSQEPYEVRATEKTHQFIFLRLYYHTSEVVKISLQCCW